MPEPCRHHVADLGAEALGRLHPAASLALASHLDGCAGCRAELAELRAAAAALTYADPARVSDRAEPPASLAARVTSRIDMERRARVRRRWTRAGAAALAVAAVAALTLVGVATLGSGSGGARTEVAFSVAPPGAASSGVVLVERRWGTEVHAELHGLESGETYWLWLSGAEDERVAAGTFAGVPGEAELVMAAAMPLSDVRRVWVTDTADAVVLDGHVPG